ncbi:MAG: Outer membrane protein assembly factor BamA [candidate division TM6 bacterium GW2011_GWF2_37_49]|nr:MAG: Outer membrane protein assembly factor BamA [candidate division TM6 bacterium GW2011_GWF2_37_49]
MRYLRFLIFIFIGIPFFQAQAWRNYGGTFPKLFKESADSAPISFLLSKISFESDVNFEKDEFLYLTELKENQIITTAQVDHACRMLMRKKKFADIDVDVYDYQAGKHLHFKLTGNWIFNKLKIEGILFGKIKYVNFYSQQPGDVFDSSLHEESVKVIRDYLKDQGYVNSKVEDELIYNKKNKSLNARISIQRGKRFTVKNVQFIVTESSYPGIDKILERKYGKVLIKSYYTKKAFKKQAKKALLLLRQKGFVNAKISITKNLNLKTRSVDLIFKLKLGKRKTLKFDGNKLFSEKYIHVNIIGIDQPEWLFSPDIISEQIKYEYYKKGYWDTTIAYNQKPDQGFVFNINEGQRIVVESIEVRDSITQTAEASAFFWEEMLQKKIFDHDTLNDGIEKLRSFYLFQGFWDFKIIDKQFIKSPDTGNYSIQILVDKGIQRFWGGLKIDEYNELEDDPFFKKYISSQDGQFIPFDLNWLTEQRSFLINHFQKQGFWYTDIQPELCEMKLEGKNNANHPNGVQVSVNWKIDTGNKVKFEKIFLRGNTSLPFRKILKEIKIKEGETWSRKKIDLSRKKLKKLDIFKSIQIQPYQLSKEKDKKSIILSLVDDDPVELRMRAGYFLTSKNFLFKQQSTPKLGSSLIFKNPLNMADKFSLDFDWTKFERKFNTEYQMPSVFNHWPMCKAKVYANRYVQPVQVGKSASAYEAFQNGFLLGLSDEYKENYHWGINLGNEWMMTKQVRGYLKFNEDLIGKYVPFVFLEPSLVIDKLDDRINTKKGTLTFASIKLMVPENMGIASGKLQFDQSYFHPIFKDFIFAARFRFGYIFRKDFEDIMPIERFYLGGPYSVRGYDIDSMPPLGVTEKDQDGNIIRQYTTSDVGKIQPNDDITREYTIQGGSAMINGNIELRAPIFKNFSGVLFQDIGILSQSGFSGFQKTWFPASGFGLRYKTPIGSVRFDMGWKWKTKLPKESSFGWYLTIGEAF